MNEYQRKILSFGEKTITLDDAFIERVSSKAGHLVAEGLPERKAFYFALHGEHECQDWCFEDYPSE